MAYAEVGDLLLGDLQLGSSVNPQDWVDRAADEIDSHIGLRYETPVDIGELTRPSMLRLKRLNAHLATGRLLLSVDNGDDDLHAYGNSLVQGALQELVGIENGMTDLPNAPLLAAGAVGATGPSVVNQDGYSGTAAFENFVMGDPPIPASAWRPGP